jgi:hypothetical protein
MYEPMLQELDLRGARVLEAMCGSGLTTGTLLSGGAQVVGLNIALRLEGRIGRFREKRTSCFAICQWRKK